MRAANRPARRARFVAALGLGAAVIGLLARCFQPDLPTCAYRCNTTEPRCPDDYECRTDGYCHLKGTTEACMYSMDLLPAPDLSLPPDQSPPPDLTGAADLRSIDM
ncbi:MAG: hypothetical protein U1A78_14950 [Polyangia bacterium]